MLETPGAMTMLPLGMRADGSGEPSVIVTMAEATFARDDGTAEAPGIATKVEAI